MQWSNKSKYKACGLEEVKMPLITDEIDLAALLIVTVVLQKINYFQL